MTQISVFLSPVVGFILTVGCGLWLSRLGRPYQSVLFTIHKLIALGTTIFAFMWMYQSGGDQGILVWHNIRLMIAVGSVVALFASGAFLSTGTFEYRAMKVMHDIALIMAAGVMLWMLLL